jgi:protein TonB
VLLGLLLTVCINGVILALLATLNRFMIVPPPPAEQPRLLVVHETREATVSIANPNPGGSPAPAADDAPRTISLDQLATIVPDIAAVEAVMPVALNVPLDVPAVAPLSVTVAPSPVKVAAPVAPTVPAAPAAPKPLTREQAQQMMMELGLAPAPSPGTGKQGGNTALGASGIGGIGTGTGTGIGSGSGALSAEGVDHPPREINKRQPAYPSFARRAGIEGAVTLKLLIDTTGHVAEVEVIKVEGHDSFRQAVLDVVKTWQFEPASHQGKVVSVWGITRVVFSLEK